MLIEDKALMWFLGLYLTLISPLEKIWPFSQATFSKRLESILKFLKCAGAFPAAGLRAGGATHHFLTFRNVGYLRLRGRWVVLKSLEHYVQECMSFLNEMRLTEDAKKLIEQFSAWLPAVIRAKGRSLAGFARQVPKPMPLAGLPVDEKPQKRPATGRGRRRKGASRGPALPRQCRERGRSFFPLTARSRLRAFSSSFS